MGVNGLWTVVGPTARPTQLATLNRKRLAVDASIWIYQFLKAVRDKEGNALRNSHVVGFFRRICKLLYFGIKPVFVFDGGAPVLKRETVRSRARRREGRREDAARTAGKLLAVQVARAAEEEENRRKAQRDRTPDEEALPADQELVYVDEIGMSQKERQATRGFKRKDQYHLPDLDVSIESMGAPNDPRIMSQAELEEYARQFHSGEDINLYDFSKIDFESPFFLSLPPGDRYNILNAARLRSRLRMGYSKEQLDGMFPDRMAFSRFQIERVKERNELTQRLMNINGMSEFDFNSGGRIAGEKGKEYVLVRNGGVEGGWALGVVSNRAGSAEDIAIDLDDEVRSESEHEESEGADDFEDVEIEGLNRLPKLWKRKRKAVDYDTNYENAVEEIARKRREVYHARALETGERARRQPSQRGHAQKNDADKLFVEQDGHNDEIDELFEDVNIGGPEEEEDDLQKAIAMSLEHDDRAAAEDDVLLDNHPSAEDLQQNQRNYMIPEADDEVPFDLQAALAESRQSKHVSQKIGQQRSPTVAQPSEKKFDGPLPFESINLGQSLLGKKKSKKVEEDLSGGFDRGLGEDTFRKQRPPEPIPAWFNSKPAINDRKSENVNVNNEYAADPDAAPSQEIAEVGSAPSKFGPAREVIDLATEDTDPGQSLSTVVKSPDDSLLELEGEYETGTEAEDDLVEVERKRIEDARNERYRIAQEIADANVDDEVVTMNDVADEVQAVPPPISQKPNFVPEPREEGPLSDEELVDWSESENGDEVTGSQKMSPGSEDDGHAENDQNLPEPEVEDEDFEDVEELGLLPAPPLLQQQSTAASATDAFALQYLIAEGDDEQNGQERTNEAREPDDDAYFADSDEELMQQLAIEAEEHARFASSLSSKTPAEAARDYENELKQLRNQQKKDRRDADEVTQVMIQECQALLRLFGLPYVTAPMEAEAQCAELVRLKLVDGIVTDDSDIFLFGGTRIYKNMFNAAKFVECYLAADLEKEYALDREKLIRFAHLLGSDYTEGIPGIGPVTALEVLTDFPTLQEFKEWCSKIQLGRPQDLETQLTTPFRRKFRNTVQKKLFLPSGFPDIRVDKAYLQPDVDSDPQEFQWGVPDLDKLRSFLMATIGWSQDRTDEILVPVIKDINKREQEGTQANITRFFPGGVGIGAASESNGPRNRTGKESGRMANAFRRLRGEAEGKRIVGDEDGTTSRDMVAAGRDSSLTEGPQKARQTQRSRKTMQPVVDIDIDGTVESGSERSTEAPKNKRRTRPVR